MLTWNLRSLICKFRNYTLQGWIRYIHLRLTGKKIRVQGECKLCGRCCQRICLEANGRWIRTENEFQRLVEKHSEYRRFIIVEKDPMGLLLFSCSWYLPEGVCRDHENRLFICREFPHESLYFSGAGVPAGCGYWFSVTVPFSKYLKESMDENK